MVLIVLYNPSDVTRGPEVFRRFLRRRMSRTTIISVRRMLSERELVKYGMPRLTDLVYCCEAW